MCKRMYWDFVLNSKKEESRKEFHQGNKDRRILGEDCFAEEAFSMALQKIFPKISLEHILLKVCQEYDIELDELFGGSRQKRITEPRSVGSVTCAEYLA